MDREIANIPPIPPRQGETLIDWLPEIFGDEAILLDSEIASEPGACLCYRLEGREACFKRGLWGPMSAKQVTTLCTGNKIEGDNEKVKEIYNRHRTCLEKVRGIEGREQRQEAWMNCVEEVLGA